MTKKDLLPLFWAILFYLLSFTEISPAYGTGLDAAYVWGLNWLFVHDQEVLTNLLYSIGPLGFLKFPTAEGNNLLYFYLFFSLIKILFLFLLLHISFRRTGFNKYVGMFLTLVVSFFLDVDILLIGNCFLLLYLSLKLRNILPFLLASLLCSMAILIKASIGISCLSLVFSFLFLHFLHIRSVKQICLYLVTFLFMYSIPFLLVFGNFEKISTYHLLIPKLSVGYSTALALQTANNWWLLTGVLLCLGAAPFIFKNKDIRIISLLLVFPLFAMWKHAMIREDISHNSIFFYALLVLWITVLILTSEFHFKTIGLAILSIGLYLLNMSNIPKWKSYGFVVAPSNFYTFVTEFSEIKETAKTLSMQIIASRTLSPATRALIGDSTIDIYPWELSYIPANDLHWKPHRTLELSPSCTNYISEENSKSFLPPHAPEFILFHLQNDQWGGYFSSFDDRYVLNDEPRVIHAILSNYSLTEKNEHYLLFRKNNKEKLMPPLAYPRQYTTWNEWISLPPVSDTSLLRIRFHHEKTILGNLKNFLYRDEAYYIDYLFPDDTMLSYRFIPSTAADGLWVHPFILNPYSKVPEASVTKIRFRHSGTTLLVKDSICFQWETIGIVSSDSIKTKSLKLFHKTDTVPEQIVLYLKNIFETSSDTKKFAVFDSTYRYSGKYSMRILPEEYSFAYKLSLDSLWKQCDCDSLNISARIRYLGSTSAKALLVINVDSTFNKSWIAGNLIPTTDQQWLSSYIGQTIGRAGTTGGKVYVYAWNNGTSPIYLDDFTLTVKCTSVPFRKD